MLSLLYHASRNTLVIVVTYSSKSFMKISQVFCMSPGKQFSPLTIPALEKTTKVRVFSEFFLFFSKKFPSSDDDESKITRSCIYYTDNTIE